LKQLIDYDLIYAATPYSKYPPNIEQAFIDACRIMARLVALGIKVYSPIAHTHPIAIHGGLNPLDHNLWIPFDHAIMGKSDALLVVKMRGWDISYGVGEEIKFFQKHNKPIHYITPDTLVVT